MSCETPSGEPQDLCGRSCSITSSLLLFLFLLPDEYLYVNDGIKRTRPQLSRLAFSSTHLPLLRYWHRVSLQSPSSLVQPVASTTRRSACRSANPGCRSVRPRESHGDRWPA